MTAPARSSNTVQYVCSYEQQKLWRHGIKWCDQPRNVQGTQVGT